MNFSGIYTSLTAPFDREGELYPAKIRHNVSRLNRTTLAGYAVGDDALEGSLLDAGEKRRFWEEAAAAAAEDKQLWAGISAGSVRESIRLAETAAGLGYHAALAAAPAERPARGAAGARRALYFEGVADRSPLPLIIDLGDVDAADAMDSSDVSRLAGHPKIAAAVIRGVDAASARKLADSLSGALPLIVGSEHLVLPLLGQGAAAALLSLTNAVPFHFLSLEEAIRTREADAAKELAQRAASAVEAVDRHGIPALKHAMDLRGYYGGPPRLPYEPVGAEVRREIEAALYELPS